MIQCMNDSIGCAEENFFLDIEDVLLNVSLLHNFVPTPKTLTYKSRLMSIGDFHFLSCFTFSFDEYIKPGRYNMCRCQKNQPVIRLCFIFIAGLSHGFSLVIPPVHMTAFFHDKRVLPLNMQAPKMIPTSLVDLNFENRGNMGLLISLAKKQFIANEECQSDPSYVWLDCWQQHSVTQLHCKLPWDEYTIEAPVDNCTNANEVITIISDRYLQGINNGQDFEKITQCPKQCVINGYEATIDPVTKEAFELPSTINGSVTIIVTYGNNEVKALNEVRSYDINNFIGEVGGSLGFFLGTSMVTFFELASSIVDRLLGKQ